MQAATSMAQINPKILDIFDTEKALRKIADYNGVSSDVVRTQEDMEALQVRATLENAQALSASAPYPLNAMMNIEEK
jgi:hypothetical protein